MERYCVWSTDILGHVYLREFDTELQAKAYAEATEQYYYLHVERTINVRAIRIEKAVSDYLTRKKKHIEV